jgi:hypothetical protein
MEFDELEMVMALEQGFGVELDDEEVAGVVTPRKAGDLIFSKLQSTEENACQNQRVFYLLRNVFLKTFSLPRGEITLDTQFRNFIPQAREQDVWPQLQSAVAARTWPELERPVWMFRLLTATSFAILGAIVVASIQSPLGLTLGLFLGIMAAIAVGVLAAKLTISYKVRIPVRLKTIRDLMPYALTSNHVAWTRKQVSTLVQQIVTEELEVPESEYHEDLHFIEDCSAS